MSEQERHVVYITERFAWCAACTWYVRAVPDDVEDSAQYHAYVERGLVRPGWGVPPRYIRPVSRASRGSGRVPGGRISRGRLGASTPVAGGLCTPESDLSGRRVV